MSKRLHDLMIKAGYAAPELAGRAKILADLIIKECAGQCESFADQAAIKMDRDACSAAESCAAMIKAHFE